MSAPCAAGRPVSWQRSGRSGRHRVSRHDANVPGSFDLPTLARLGTASTAVGSTRWGHDGWGYGSGITPLPAATSALLVPNRRAPLEPIERLAPLHPHTMWVSVSARSSQRDHHPGEPSRAAMPHHNHAILSNAAALGETYAIAYFGRGGGCHDHSERNDGSSEPVPADRPG